MAALIVGIAAGLFGGLIAWLLVAMIAGDDDDSVEVRCERLRREAQAESVAKALARQAATFRGN